MNGTIKKPLVVFDGDCNFCRFWIARYKMYTGDRVDYSPYQEVSHRFPEVPLKNFQTAVHLIMPEGMVYSGAEAVFRALAISPEKRWPLWLYENVPGTKPVSEFFYRLVADNRGLFSFFTRLFWGQSYQPETYFLSRMFFSRILGIVFLIAFVSLWTQVRGLVGSEGVLPVEPYLKAVQEQYGPQAVRLLPTVFWFDASDRALQVVCALGSLFSLLLIAGLSPAPVIFILWALYLSFVSICREFLSFQWDILLLETALLAVFLPSLQIKTDLSREAPPSKMVLFLFKWLLFRLMLMSGLVKLLSRDPTWGNLTALTFHYETQPLPTWLGWYMHQLPAWFHKASCALMFFIEVGCPFLFFAPRRLRAVAGGAGIGLQILILLTGNYCFFNILSIALCLFLFDDSFYPEKWRRRLEGRRAWSPQIPARAWPRWIIIPFFVVALFMTSLPLTNRLGFRFRLPGPVLDGAVLLSHFNSFNGYGLFAVMTTSRPEIILEGSLDGKTWVPYEFKFKPGETGRRPRFVEPHQPRLDWQMWFAALGSVQDNPWVVGLIQRLLQGSPEVLKLLGRNPFPQGPPEVVRAVVYDYRFTDLKKKRETGQWWDRQYKGLYCPPLSLHSKYKS